MPLLPFVGFSFARGCSAPVALEQADRVSRRGVGLCPPGRGAVPPGGNRSRSPAAAAEAEWGGGGWCARFCAEYGGGERRGALGGPPPAPAGRPGAALGSGSALALRERPARSSEKPHPQGAQG